MTAKGKNKCVSKQYPKTYTQTQDVREFEKPQNVEFHIHNIASIMYIEVGRTRSWNCR